MNVVKNTTINNDKPIIAIDVDDVLAQFVPAFCVFAKEKWNENVTISNFTEDWRKIFKVKDDEIIKNRAIEMFSNYDFYDQIKIVPKANETLAYLSQKFSLVPVTSRVATTRDVTNNWLMRNFGDIFREIVFSGAYESDDNYEQRVNLSKGRICREIGAEFLIDDQPKHVNGAAENGVKSLLFGDYNWNRDAEISPNVTRIKNWLEVAKYFGID